MSTQKNSDQQLHRVLEERHINLMALGAAIGVGLFLGSATAIKMAGPAVIIAYGLGGAVIFFMMRALGEMAIHNPVAGSFSRYATDYLGPLPGYITGWNYWLLWLITCMTEIVAVGVYMGYWYPDVQPWIWGMAALAIMASINFIAVRAFGEFEFWFALIKISAIVLMIIMSLGIILFGIGNDGVAMGFSNMWANGGFMPNGWDGVLRSLQIVMFAYVGVEMIGLTAGEAKNPEKSLARAVDSVFWRILIFYIISLTMIMSIYPWNEITSDKSPFVMIFERMGIPAAAGVINFVVLTAALSSCNSGIFSTGRMLFSLAQQKQALPMFDGLNRKGIPGVAILASVLILGASVLASYQAAEDTFLLLTSASTFCAVWTWLTILISQLGFRRQLNPQELKVLKYKVPLYPLGSYFAILFLLTVVVMIAFSPQWISLVLGLAWVAFLVVMYYVMGYHKRAKQ